MNRVSVSTKISQPSREIPWISLTGIGAGILLGFLFSSLTRAIVSPFIIFFVGLFVGIVWISQYTQSYKISLTTLFLGAYLLRTLSSVLFYFVSYFYQDPAHLGFLFINDGWAYSQDAIRMVKMQEFGYDPIIYGVSVWSTGRDIAPVPYEFWNRFVYTYTGESPLSMFLLNSFFGTLTVLIVYDFVYHLFHHKIALRAATIVACWPSLILWSTQNLKDPLVICSLALFTSSFVLIWKRPTILRIVFLIASAAVLFHLQKLFLHLGVAAGFLAWFLCLEIHKLPWARICWAVFLIGVLLVLIFTAAGQASLLNRITGLQNTIIHYVFSEHASFFENQLETLNRLRKVRGYGESAFLRNVNISSPGSLLLFSPLLLFYVCLGPFPWQAFGFFKFFGAMEMLVFYFFLPAFCRGIRFGFQERKQCTLFLLGLIFMVMILIALLDANLGTAFRHRASILPFVLVFVGMGWEKKHAGTA